VLRVGIILLFMYRQHIFRLWHKIQVLLLVTAKSGNGEVLDSE